MMGQSIIEASRTISVAGSLVDLAFLSREGEGVPIVMLHGFGSAKEDYLDVFYDPAFAGKPLFAFDAPGAGGSICFGEVDLTVDFMVDLTIEFLKSLNSKNAILMGHSMGGLTALLVAEKMASGVSGFINIEGNLSPEDCSFSRQVRIFNDEDDELFMSRFVKRLRADPDLHETDFSERVARNVQIKGVRRLLNSIVDLSDHGNLLSRFVALPCPKVFVCGSQSRQTYRETLQSLGVEVRSIPGSGHFPMHTNPVGLYKNIAQWLEVKAL